MPSTPSIPPTRVDQPAHPFVIPAEFVPERRGAVVFLSSTTRNGDWILPRLFRVVACMGNVELDLTTAKLAPGESQIEIRCLFGNVEITVPPEIRVEAEGHPFMGSFDFTRTAPSLEWPDAPVLRITGSVLMGAVTIKVADPHKHAERGKRK
jgi:cell wall-active antibiotic response 4TMS protein YvqF